MTTFKPLVALAHIPTVPTSVRKPQGKHLFLGDVTQKTVSKPNVDPIFIANTAFVQKSKQRKITKGIAHTKA